MLKKIELEIFEVIKVLAHVGCEDVIDHISADLLNFLDGKVLEDIRVSESEDFESTCDVMLLKNTLIVVAHSKLRHGIHFECIRASAVRCIVAKPAQYQAEFLHFIQILRSTSQGRGRQSVGCAVYHGVFTYSV